MADQLTARALPAYGNRVARTPHMDALAAAGVVFESFYCNSPLCAPSRFSFLSGRQVSTIGAYDNAAEFPAQRDGSHHLRTGHHGNGEHLSAGFAHDAVERAFRLRVDIAVDDQVLFFSFEHRSDGQGREREAAVLWFGGAGMENNNHDLNKHSVQNPETRGRTAAFETCLPGPRPPFPSIPGAMDAPFNLELGGERGQGRFVKIFEAGHGVGAEAIAFLKIVVTLGAHLLAVFGKLIDG